jgi:hypothetical protein
MGFDADELVQHAKAAGLEAVQVLGIPAGYVKSEIDGHLAWQVLSATREHGFRNRRTKEK